MIYVSHHNIDDLINIASDIDVVKLPRTAPELPTGNMEIIFAVVHVL